MGKGYAGTSSTDCAAPSMPPRFGPATLRSSPLLSEPEQKTCRRLPTGFRGQQRRMPTVASPIRCQMQPGHETSCCRFVLLISRSPFHRYRAEVRKCEQNALNYLRIYERFSVDYDLHAGLRLRSRNVSLHER